MADPIHLKPLSTDAEGAEVVIRLQDPEGRNYEARLPSMAAMSMVGALRTSLEEAGKHQVPGQWSIELHRIQLEEAGEFVFVRMFVSAETSHEYRLSSRTDLARALVVALEELNQSKTTHPGSPTRQ